MAIEQIMFRGTIKQGVIVPDTEMELPDGTPVQIMVIPLTVPSELQAEFDAWECLGDEAWELINQWEAEEQK